MLARPRVGAAHEGRMVAVFSTSGCRRCAVLANTDGPSHNRCLRLKREHRMPVGRTHTVWAALRLPVSRATGRARRACLHKRSENRAAVRNRPRRQGTPLPEPGNVSAAWPSGGVAAPPAEPEGYAG